MKIDGKRVELTREMMAGIVLGVMRSTGAITEKDYKSLKLKPIPTRDEEKVTA